MGAKGFQGEESSVWAAAGGEALWGQGGRKPFPGVEQRQAVTPTGRSSIFGLSTLPLPTDPTGHTTAHQGARQLLRSWGGEEKDTTLR